MVMTFKMKKAVCISLSHACLILGLLNLLASILFIVHCSIRVPEKFISEFLIMLVSDVVGVCTCLLMIFGSMMGKRWLLIPHIAWVIYYIIKFTIDGLTKIVYFVLNGLVQPALMYAALVCCVLPLCICYWIVMFNRFREIKEKQSAPPVLVEMQ